MDLAISSENNWFYQLAYSVGFFLGDGSLSATPFVSTKNGKTYFHNDVVFVCSDLEPIELVTDQLERVTGKRSPMTTRILPSKLPHYRVTSHKREIFDFFSVNTAHRSQIPQYYFSASKDEKLEVIRGMMDSDGHVAEFVDKHDPRYEVKRWMLGFSNTELKLVQGIASLMQSIGIKVGQVTAGKKAGYRDTYIIHPNPRSFVDAGGSFYATRKQAKLTRYVQHVIGSETLRTAPST